MDGTPAGHEQRSNDRGQLINSTFLDIGNAHGTDAVLAMERNTIEMLWGWCASRRGTEVKPAGIRRVAQPSEALGQILRQRAIIHVYLADVEPRTWLATQASRWAF